MQGLGARIRTLRENRGLTTADVARAVGVSRSYISRLESEERRLNTSLIGKLSHVLGVEPGVLFGGASRESATKRIRILTGQLLRRQRLNPLFIDRVVAHAVDEILPDDPGIVSIREWDRRMLDLGGSVGIIGRFGDRVDQIAERLELLDRTMSYQQLRERLKAQVAAWTPEEREAFVVDLLPEILQRQRHYRRLTGENIFVDEDSAADRLGRFPLLVGRVDPAELLALRHTAIDLTSGFRREGLFALRMEDESMAPRYPKGTIVVCDSDREAQSGRAVVAIANLPPACREVQRDGASLWLTPLNASFPASVHPTEAVRWAHPVVRSISD